MSRLTSRLTSRLGSRLGSRRRAPRRGATGSSRAVGDPGAQPERTYQAWTRTALSLTGCALLATRLAPGAGVAAVTLATCGVAAALAVVAVQRRRLRAAVLGAAPRSVAALTGLTVALAAGALGLLVAAPLR